MSRFIGSGRDTYIDYGTVFPNEKRINIAMDKTIHMINPQRNPFLVLSKVIGMEQVPQPKYEWLEDENFTSRHFKAEFVDGTDTDVGDHPGGIKFHPREWQAIEVMATDASDATAKGVAYITITDGTDTVYGYLKKSALTGRQGHAWYKDTAGTKSASADTTVHTSAFQITCDMDAITTANNDMDMEVTSTDATIGWSDGAELDVRVYTMNFSQDGASYGPQYGGFKEGSGTIPDSRKTVANYYNYTQIFKTSLQVTGTMMSNKSLIGGPERARLRAKKALQHATDLEYAIMFNHGGTEGTYWGVMDSSENPRRVFKGLGVGQTSAATGGWIQTFNGGWDTDLRLSYASPTYDALVVMTEKLFDDTDVGSDTKILYSSKKWLTAFSRMVMHETAGSPFQISVPPLASATGLKITRVVTAHGDLLLTPHPMLRGPYEDYAVAIDPKNVRLTYLQGRNTHLRANIQTPDLDGVMDEYLTEMGLKVMHEHTHAIFKLS